MLYPVLKVLRKAGMGMEVRMGMKIKMRMARQNIPDTLYTDSAASTIAKIPKMGEIPKNLSEESQIIVGL